jgi:orotidine-5'-phosphate decarboxylase
MSAYIARLLTAMRQKGNPVVVGLDPRFSQLPADVVAAARARGGDQATVVAAAFEEFCFRILDVVAPLVPAVKPQAAFFEEWGPEGMAVLARVIRRARQLGLIVICDAKRGDIGTTAEAYARGFLAGSDPSAAPWGADALTVNPYMGTDTLEPFVKLAVERGAGLYVLVRTSNPGSGSFQNHGPAGKPLYERVAAEVEQICERTRGDQPFGVAGAVVGATYPQELVALREQMPHAHLLIPGYGSQGGSAADVASAFGADGTGAVVNNSRGIIFAYEKADYAARFGTRWEAAVEAATQAMIVDLATHTTAGQLRSK